MKLRQKLGRGGSDGLLPFGKGSGCRLREHRGKACLMQIVDRPPFARHFGMRRIAHRDIQRQREMGEDVANCGGCDLPLRSEEHTSELQSLMRISYAVFCLKKQKL